MDDDGITCTDIGNHGLEFRPIDILSGNLVNEHFIDRNIFQLPVRVLVNRADPDITDALTLQVVFPTKMYG